MPDYTPRLNLPKPLGSENNTRANFNALIDAIDSAAETPAGAQAKADAAQQAAKTYTDIEVGKRETPQGAQAKADAARDAAIAWATAENVTLIDYRKATVAGSDYPIGVTAFQVSNGSNDGWPANQGTVLNVRLDHSYRFTQYYTASSTAGNDTTFIRTWRQDTGWSDFKIVWTEQNLSNPAVTDSNNDFEAHQYFKNGLRVQDGDNDPHLMLRYNNGQFELWPAGSGYGIPIQIGRDSNVVKIPGSIVTNSEQSIVKTGQNMISLERTDGSNATRWINHLGWAHYAIANGDVSDTVFVLTEDGRLGVNAGYNSAGPEANLHVGGSSKIEGHLRIDQQASGANDLLYLQQQGTSWMKFRVDGERIAMQGYNQNDGVVTLLEWDKNNLNLRSGTTIGGNDVALANGNYANLRARGTTKADVGLGNVTNDAQLKIASNLSDVANVSTARSNLGLTGSSNTTHYHDSRYYTKSQVDSELNSVKQSVGNGKTAIRDAIIDAGGTAPTGSPDSYTHQDLADAVSTVSKYASGSTPAQATVQIRGINFDVGAFSFFYQTSDSGGVSVMFTNPYSPFVRKTSTTAADPVITPVSGGFNITLDRPAGTDLTWEAWGS